MERAIFMIIVICYLCGSIAVFSVQAIESPQYRVVHTESDFEVRIYRESSWMSALVRDITSFEKATKDGFHRFSMRTLSLFFSGSLGNHVVYSHILDCDIIRLYQYIHGDNLNSSRISITAPVITSIVPSAHEPEYYVRLYLPAKYDRTPPQPFTELNLQIVKQSSHCVAVRKFSGFAKDDDINEEFGTLMSSLDKHLNRKPEISKEKSAFAIAQYNASFHVSGRLNEVWMDLSGFTNDC